MTTMEATSSAAAAPQPIAPHIVTELPGPKARAIIARDEAVATGITINGLPIMLKKPGSLDDPDLDLYFRDCVIGGQGAFMVPVRERSQFQQAIKTKIILEVSGLLSPPAPLVTRIQTGEARAACMAGETRWRDRMGN